MFLYSLDFSYLYFLQDTELNSSRSAPNSPQKIVASQMIKHKSNNDLNNGNNDDMDIFVWRRNGAPKIAGSKQQNVLYTCMAPSSSVKKDKRVHCKQPVHILDAPGFTSDFCKFCSFNRHVNCSLFRFKYIRLGLY